MYNCCADTFDYQTPAPVTVTRPELHGPIANHLVYAQAPSGFRFAIHLSMKDSNHLIKWNIFILSISGHHCFGDVNMKDASFFKSWVDHALNRDRRDFKIQRTYKSRSLFNGVFGFGWCSQLDASLKFKTTKQIELTDCLKEKTVLFVKDDKHKEPVFISRDNPNDKLNLKKDIYIRRQGAHIIQRFDRNGQLMVRDYGIAWISQTSEGQVKEIRFIDGQKLNYKYKGEDLISVENDGDILYKYQYDELHNLIKIFYPDKTFEAISYDKDNDRVHHYQDRYHCVENYMFKIPDPNKAAHHISTVEKKCRERPTLKTQYEFWHKVRSDGHVYLDRVKITSDQTTTEISYDPLNGRISRLRTVRPSRATAFEKILKGEAYEGYKPAAN